MKTKLILLVAALLGLSNNVASGEDSAITGGMGTKFSSDYDRRGQLLKVLEASDYREYLDGIWRSHRFAMKNVQTKKQTDLIWKDYQFKTGLTDNAFEKGKLNRIR